MSACETMRSVVVWAMAGGAGVPATATVARATAAHFRKLIIFCPSPCLSPTLQTGCHASCEE